MHALARLDHIIWTVRDISAEHEHLLESGFPEAWPIGAFWSAALTSGIALGGANLELIQPNELTSEKEVALTLVFEPTSLEVAASKLRNLDIPFSLFEKVEADKDLLRKRGFTGAESDSPRRICTNLLPSQPEDSPFDFFVCDYTPFLRKWLSPDHERLQSEKVLKSIAYGTPDPAAARALLEALGYEGNVSIEFEEREVRGVKALFGQGWTMYMDLE